MNHRPFFWQDTRHFSRRQVDVLSPAVCDLLQAKLIILMTMLLLQPQLNAGFSQRETGSLVSSNLLKTRSHPMAHSLSENDKNL
jgi:hypothetical protein